MAPTNTLSQSSALELPAAAERRKTMLPGRALRVLGPAALGALIAFLAGGLLMVITGHDPAAAYGAMLEGAFGSVRGLSEVALKATPLLLIGLGLTVAFRAQVWNIGCEGQYYVGALFGSFVALTFPGLPALVLLPAMLLAGVIGGALWGLIPGLLRTRRGINEIISTLMLNYIAILLVDYMARVPLRDPKGFMPESAQFVRAARLPGLFGTRIHVGALIALALIPLMYVLIWRTPFGFRLRAIGSRASVARFAGINVERGVILALVFSGALAGLAGILEVSYLHTRLKDGISGGYGFTGILVALLGQLHPLGALFAALFFAILEVGSYSMEMLSGIPAPLVDAIQALMVLFVLGFDAYFKLRRSEK